MNQNFSSYELLDTVNIRLTGPIGEVVCVRYKVIIRFTNYRGKLFVRGLSDGTVNRMMHLAQSKLGFISDKSDDTINRMKTT